MSEDQWMKQGKVPIPETSGGQVYGAEPDSICHSQPQATLPSKLVTQLSLRRTNTFWWNPSCPCNQQHTPPQQATDSIFQVWMIIDVVGSTSFGLTGSYWANRNINSKTSLKHLSQDTKASWIALDMFQNIVRNLKSSSTNPLNLAKHIRLGHLQFDASKRWTLAADGPFSQCLTSSMEIMKVLKVKTCLLLCLKRSN